MRTPMRLLSALFVLIVVAAACASDNDESASTDDGASTSPGDAFGDATWQLTSATVDSESVDLLDSHPVTFNVIDDVVGGTAACNSYNGTLTTGGDTLFSDFAATEMACEPPAAMALEAAFLAALADVSDASLDGDTLVLTSDSVELRFEEEPPMAEADFVGTTWLLESLVDGDTVSSVIAGMEIDVLFDDNGSITGTDGCNRFNGTYELEGDVLTVGPLAQTRMACPGEITTQSNHILLVLGQPSTVSIDGDALELTTEAGTGLVYRSA